MTYPPQQPGPYGQQPPQGPYGQQPDPFAAQPAYQGFGGYPGADGGYPGGQPPKKNTGKIVAIVAIAVLVLGGAGVGVFFLTKDKGGNTPAASTTTATSESKSSSSSSSSRPTTSRTTRTSTSSASSGGADEPQAIVDAYIKAYERKSFSSVTSEACDAYKTKYGTDTTELEKTLADYEITGKSNGEPDVKGSTASAKIDLTLTKGGVSKDAAIRIKIVKEDGAWKFCGEEAA